MRLQRRLLMLAASSSVLALTFVLVSIGFTQGVEAAPIDGNGSIAVLQQTPASTPMIPASTSSPVATSMASTPMATSTTMTATMTTTTSTMTTTAATTTPTRPSASPTTASGSSTGTAGGGVVPPATGSQGQAAPGAAPAQAGGIDPSLAATALGSLGALSVAGGLLVRRKRR
ncbi:MAG: hypothetical protein U0893_06815 [Chloroflexota bacterium]